MVLVTGATGILGRVITLKLLKKGEKVLATKRASSNLEDVKNSFQYYTDQSEEWFDKIHWIDLDFEDLRALCKITSEVSEIYHCLGKVSFDPKDKRDLYQTNVDYTKNLLYACENSMVQKFLFVSSISVLDGINENGIINEESDFNPKVPHSHYAFSKYLAEMEVWRASAEGMNTVIVNPGVIIGSGNWQQSSGTLFKAFSENDKMFSGGTGYVDVRDVADICIRLMDAGKFGHRYVVVAENKTYKEVGDIVRTEQNLKPISLISDGILKGFSFLRYFGFIIPKLRMLTPANINALTSFHVISSDKIILTLGFSFIPIAESVKFHVHNFLAKSK